jgi:hypothetical protein
MKSGNTKRSKIMANKIITLGLIFWFLIVPMLTAQDSSKPPEKVMYVNTGDGLNLRTSPQKNSKKIYNLPILTKVIILEKSNVFDTIDTKHIKITHINSKVEEKYEKLKLEWINE